MQLVNKTFQYYLFEYGGYIVGVLIFLTSLVFPPYYKQGYQGIFQKIFLIVATWVVILANGNAINRLKKGVLAWFIVSLGAGLFWNYKDKPWFSPPDPKTCDGPCYGWFSFENESPAIEILIFGFGYVMIVWLLRISLGSVHSYYLKMNKESHV